MLAYRIDRGDYELGSVISAGGEYQKKIDDKGTYLESILEKRRPNNKPMRAKSLFLFETKTDAERFWTIMTNGKYYEVIFEEKEVLHIGDMSLTEEMFQNTSNEERLIKLADKYWAGEKSSNPRMEILVLKAIVHSIVSKSEDERNKNLRKRMFEQ